MSFRRPMEQAEVLSSLAGSTTSRKAELVEMLAAMFAQSDGRRARALESSQQRSAAIRAGIRRAIGPKAKPRSAQEVQNRIRWRPGPEHYGLKNTPDLPTIRSVIEEMLAEEKDK